MRPIRIQATFYTTAFKSIRESTTEIRYIKENKNADQLSFLKAISFQY